MFVVVAVFALWLGWELKFVHERRLLRHYIWERGGIRDRDAGLYRYWNLPEKKIPIWRRWMGDDAVHNLLLPTAFTQDEVDRIESFFPEATVFADAAEPKQPWFT
jgi:hypothetical protein